MEFDSFNWKNDIEVKDGKIFIVKLNRAMNIILLLYVKIESKSSAFGMKENLEDERIFSFFLLWTSGGT